MTLPNNLTRAELLKIANAMADGEVIDLGHTDNDGGCGCESCKLGFRKSHDAVIESQYAYCDPTTDRVVPWDYNSFVLEFTITVANGVATATLTGPAINATRVLYSTGLKQDAATVTGWKYPLTRLQASTGTDGTFDCDLQVHAMDVEIQSDFFNTWDDVNKTNGGNRLDGFGTQSAAYPARTNELVAAINGGISMTAKLGTNGPEVYFGPLSMAQAGLISPGENQINRIGRCWRFKTPLTFRKGVDAKQTQVWFTYEKLISVNMGNFPYVDGTKLYIPVMHRIFGRQWTAPRACPL